MKFNFSQRGFTTAVVFIIGLGLGTIAVYNGYRLPSFRNVTVEDMLSFFLPLTGVVVILNQFFSVLDALIADKKLASGDWLALFSMPTWWSTIVACSAGIYQFFGGQIISPDVQVLIVNLLQAFVYLLLRSFTERIPDPIVAQKGTYTVGSSIPVTYTPKE